MLPARMPCTRAAHQRRRTPAAAARGSPPPSRPRARRQRPPPCRPSAPSLHAARDALADRLLEALAAGGDEEGALVARLKGLVLEAAGALRASRDWPLLDAALATSGRPPPPPPPPPLLVAAGLGSLGGYRERLAQQRQDGSASSTPGARRRACPRAGMRLFQLALATLLLERQKAAAGGKGEGDGDGGPQPSSFASCAADPEYDTVDLALLRSLGFSSALRGTVGEGLCAAAAAAAAAADGRSAPPSPPSPPPCPPTGCLAYMPLCPRDAYDEVLGAYWSPDSLPGLAILGTSFGAQGESAALIAALSAFGGGGGGMGGGGMMPGAEAPEPPSEKQALLAASPSDLLIETPAPDFACHGVGIALHTFARGEAAAAFFAAEEESR